MDYQNDSDNRYLRSALFVDFDNVYLSLKRQNNSLANAFATQPSQWIDWLEQFSLKTIDSNSAFRRILVRRCYLNPKAFGQYRPYLINSAFETIDCPVLTSQGKTSTDIHIVLDMIDLLGHRVHYDEYILMSADADFRPALLMLRKHDRRVTVVATGPSSKAYKSSCDLLIELDHFIEALGFQDEFLKSTASIRSTNANIPSDLRSVYSEYVKSLIRESSRPMALAVVAANMREKFSELISGWHGYNNFKAFLYCLDISKFKLTVGGPGYLFDPKRHDEPDVIQAISIDTNAFEGLDSDLPDLVDVIWKLTNTPPLLPEQYRNVFTYIAEHINENGYSMSDTSKYVRDKCAKSKTSISRHNINIILRGLYYTGHRFDGDSEIPTHLAELYYKNTVTQCQAMQIDLSDRQKELVHLWIVGSID